MNQLQRLKNIFIATPRGLASQYTPEYFGIVYSAVAGFFVNTALFIVYFFAGLNQLYWLSLSGYILWSLAIFFARKCRLVSAVIMGEIEIVAHILLLVTVIGTQYGAQHIIWCGVAFAAFAPNNQKHITRMLGLICCAVLASIYAFVPTSTEVVPFQDHVTLIYSILTLTAALPIFFVLLATKHVQLNMQKTLEELASIDLLTKLANRRAITSKLECLFINCQSKHANTFCICIADIDYFKQINDQYGHDIGDQVLQQLAHIFRNASSKHITFGRWGGEEFLILFEDTINQQATEHCEKLKALIQSSKLSDKHLTISLSFGVSQYQPQDTINSLLKRADDSLYSAKARGRNCVVAL